MVYTVFGIKETCLTGSLSLLLRTDDFPETYQIFPNEINLSACVLQIVHNDYENLSIQVNYIMDSTISNKSKPGIIISSLNSASDRSHIFQKKAYKDRLVHIR